MRNLRVAMYFAVALVVAAPVRAQPLFGHASSIEATIVNADEVVVGRITGLDAPPDPDTFGVHGITIEVDQILKEPFTEPLSTLASPRRIGVRATIRPTTLASWKSRSTRLLVARDDDSAGAATLIDLTDGKPEVLTADFRLLRDPDDVLRAAREVIRRTPAPVRRLHTFGLQVPSEAVAGTQWREIYGTGGHLILDVPVDDQLERRAWDDIRSDRYPLREQGIRALRYFRSDANIARARTLLDDPGWSHLARAEANHGVEVRFYGVRQHAYNVLKSWGVDVEKPTVREEVRVR